jgi:hypothetical protein
MCTFCLTVLSVSANDSIDRKVKIYPNPIERSTVLTIELSTSDSNDITVILYNTVGKVIHTLKTTNKTVVFNAPDISGIYLLRIVENQKVIAVEKIVVKE